MSETLDELADLDVDELLELFAGQLTAGGAPLDRSHKIAVGRSLLLGWFSTVKATLCGASEGEIPEDKELVVRDAAAIVDLVSSLHGQIPVATFAVLVVKYGLATLCRET